MPTHRIGREQQQDPVRLRNLLAQAEKKLSEYGLRQPEIQELLGPAEGLIPSKDFWQHQSDGLAIFLSNNFSQMYRVPTEFEELLVIANNFHIKPLLPILERGKKFYILALSLNNIRLFLATQDVINEIELNIRSNIDEVLWMDDPQRHLALHTAPNMAGGTRGGTAIFHGHSVADEEKNNVLRFFHYVDQGLNELWEDKTIPMVLAGVDYLLPIYREANTYPNLLREAIIGNPEKQSLKELHEGAWQIVRPIFEANQQQALDKFQQLNGQQSKLATSDLNTAVRAANFGTVETLFVPLDVQRWGRYDAGNNKIVLESEPKPDNKDILDFAAAQTILNSGRVFAVPSEELPGDGDLAAILRYAV
jgi:hypothetical protein